MEQSDKDQCQSVCLKGSSDWTCFEKCPIDPTAAVVPVAAVPASAASAREVDGVRYRTGASTQAESHSRLGAHNLASGFDF